MATHRLSLRRSTIASRLAILVTVPLLGALAMGSVIAAEAWGDTEAAQNLRRDAQLVDLLSELAVTVEAEADGYRALLEAEALGVPILGDSSLSIVGMVDWEGSSLGDLTAELAAQDPEQFADGEEVLELVDDLTAFTALTSAPEAAPEAEFTELLDRIGAEIDRTLSAQIEQLDVRFAQVEPPADLVAVYAAIGPARELPIAARDQRNAIALYLLPIAGDEESVAFQDMVSATDLYQQRVEAVRSTLPDQYEALFLEATDGEGQSAYRELVEDALAGRANPVDADSELLSLLPAGLVIFVDGLEAINHLTDLTGRLTADLVAGTVEVEGDATSRLTRVTLAVTLLTLVMFTVSSFTIRSITGPVQRLLDRARRITDGRLDPVDGSASTGPTDIAMVHHALDEMAANLATLGDQAEALSAGRLDDDILSRRVVGRLGDSLHGSVARLRSMTARLEHEATHDALTGLPNRAALIALLDLLLTGSVEGRQPIAAVMLDLDGFKQANDNMGHAIGDEVLCQVANRLRARSGGHFVARLGGDEFMLVITAESGDDPVELARLAIHAISEPMRLSSGTTVVSGSAGLVRTDADNWLAPSEILRRVDLALYEAKADAPGTVVEFDQRLHDSLLASTKLSGELGQAISRNEFFLMAQPIIEMDRGVVKGFEALIRWRSPLRGLVPPDMFIGVAEQSELISHIDTWVIHETAALLESWQQSPGLEHLTLSINISARHLSRVELPTEIEQAIARHQLRPEAYLVEMTESQLIPNLARAEANLRRLKEIGVRIAIDDFGTGYASVAHLRSVDFDRLKIDRSFLTHLDDETDRSLANLLVSLGRDLDLDVVAEGIETDDQLRWARGAGCTHGQGYLFGRPQPIETITAATVAELDNQVSEQVGLPSPNRLRPRG